VVELRRNSCQSPTRARVLNVSQRRPQNLVNSMSHASLKEYKPKLIHKIFPAVGPTDMYEVPDAVPPIHAVSSHVATDKDPSKFRSIFSDNSQPIATRGKIVRGTLLAGASPFPLSLHFCSFAPFYLFFVGFNYFLLLSIPFLSTRIAPLRFQARGRRN